MTTSPTNGGSMFRFTVKYDEHGLLGIDSFMVRSAFKLCVRVYGPVA